MINWIIERIIDRSRLFNKDFNRIKKGPHKRDLEPGGEFPSVVNMLATGQPLEFRHHDHALIGNWKGYRGCHIKPDLVLIYKKIDDDVLYLARLGSHAKVFKK